MKLAFFPCRFWVHCEHAIRSSLLLSLCALGAYPLSFICTYICYAHIHMRCMHNHTFCSQRKCFWLELCQLFIFAGSVFMTSLADCVKQIAESSCRCFLNFVLIVLDVKTIEDISTSSPSNLSSWSTCTSFSTLFWWASFYTQSRA